MRLKTSSEITECEGSSVLTVSNSGYNVSNTSNAQTRIFSVLGRDDLLAWVVLAYPTVAMCIMPLCRRLSLLADLKLQFYIHSIVFVVGVVVSGTAKDMNAVILGRAISGAGGAGVYHGLLLYGIVYARPDNTLSTRAVIDICFVLGLFLGPVIAGAFADSYTATWRWAFFVNIPIVLFLWIGYYFFLPPLHLRRQTANGIAGNPRQQSWLVETDWLGWILHCGSVMMLHACLVFSGHRWTWGSTSADVAWVLTGFLLIAYATQQFRCIGTTPASRIIVFGAIGIEHVLAFTVTSMASASYTVNLQYAPLVFLLAQGSTLATAAAHLLPYVGSLLFTRILHETLFKRAKVDPGLNVLGGGLILVASVLQMSADPYRSASIVMGILAISGGGVGLVFRQTAILLQDQDQQSVERANSYAALFATLHFGAISLATSICACIYQNLGFIYLSDAMLSGGEDDVTGDEIWSMLAGFRHPSLEGNLSLVDQVAEAIIKAIAGTFSVAVANGAIIMLNVFAAGWAIRLTGRARIRTNSRPAVV
ncbi:hypothetical protein MCOR02_012112 [Pyricularia oryzae]|nr:hypothetical protein MCOR02_012112 [Pyricularia oryzae]KAI6477403.1 hypothetical protein MCOR13_011777 [Pyricularia oryzae]KAI6615308.1 hypothetical protein MCOR14_011264 [Pyricularia oryzae]